MERLGHVQAGWCAATHGLGALHGQVEGTEGPSRSKFSISGRVTMSRSAAMHGLGDLQARICKQVVGTTRYCWVEHRVAQRGGLGDAATGAGLGSHGVTGGRLRTE